MFLVLVSFVVATTIFAQSKAFYFGWIVFVEIVNFFLSVLVMWLCLC